MSPLNISAVTDSIGMPLRFIAATQQSLNSAGAWIAMGFPMPFAKTLGNGRVYIATVTGTLAATDITIEIYSSVNGQPGVSLASTTIDARTIGWKSFAAPFNYALAIAPQYFLVVKNVNGTPASNFCSVRFWNDTSSGSWGADSNSFPASAVTYSWAAILTSNSGTLWTSTGAMPTVRLDFTDGTYGGFPTEFNNNAALGATDIYLKRAAGLQGVVPAGMSPNFAGAGVFARKFGTPTGDLLIKHYVGSAEVKRTTIPKEMVNTTGIFVPVWAPSAYRANPGDYVTIALRNSVDTDLATNGYRFGEYNIDSEANSIALMGGNWQFRSVYTLDDSTSPDPTTWNQTINSLPTIRFFFQPGNPYNSLAGGRAAQMLGAVANITSRF